jgi:hypothetical protein
MKKYILIEAYDEPDSHIGGVDGTYATLCGMDGDDPSCGQFTTGSSNKVTCPHCINIWQMCRSIPARDLAK